MHYKTTTGNQHESSFSTLKGIYYQKHPDISVCFQPNHMVFIIELSSCYDFVHFYNLLLMFNAQRRSVSITTALTPSTDEEHLKALEKKLSLVIIHTNHLWEFALLYDLAQCCFRKTKLSVCRYVKQFGWVHFNIRLYCNHCFMFFLM